MPQEVPLTVSEPELVVTIAPLKWIPRALSVPFAAVPVIITLPAPVAEMLADDDTKTPLGVPSVPHEVPLTVSKPELLVTLELRKSIPWAKADPFAAVPVIVTLPVPVAEMLADDDRLTPLEF